MPSPPPAEAGFTLIEVMVSTALFGLIALAGFTLLDSELRVQARTDGRLERLGDLQRAMYVLTADFEQMSSPTLVANGGAVAFRRHAGRPAGGEITIGYALQGGALQRTIGRGGSPVAQPLLTGVSAVHWRFYDREAGWGDIWPIPGQEAKGRPEAVSVDVAIKGSGVLRRLIELPTPLP